MQFLKQSTAITLKLGPFLDDTDGKTAETGLTLSQSDVRLSKNGGDFAQKNDANSATHDESGWYDCALNTTDTGTLGRLDVFVHESGALPVWREFMVVPANIYDSLVGGSDYLDVNAAQIEGSDATDQINAACDTALSDYDAPTKAEMDSGFSGLNDISVADIFNYVTENGKKFIEQFRLMFAALCGKVSGAGTTTVSIRDDADSKNRIVATVDLDGNRSAFTTKDGS